VNADLPVMTDRMAELILDALPNAILCIAPDRAIIEANPAAESFFEIGRGMLLRRRIDEIVAASSPLLGLIDDALETGKSFRELELPVAMPKLSAEKLVDVYVMPLGNGDGSVLCSLKERSFAEKIGAIAQTRTSNRTLSAMGAMLAHEIKNPLSGIRGAAQLLDTSLGDEDRALTRLIRDETDRIVRLVDRFETLADTKPIRRDPVNIHLVLDHVASLATSGFARHIRLSKRYDPSLPPVEGDPDQLIQLFLNLVKNAAEAIENEQNDGEITLVTAYRSPVRIKTPDGAGSIALPIEVSVRDNGRGVDPAMFGGLFEPFVTSKQNGSGLGLALVAKIVADHRGIVECEPGQRRTTFRVLLPIHRDEAGDGIETRTERW
jgi:two-component system, NtrC family, nitrogen regulation sensor histidine kinase GlnL